ncbi:unnamed protein product [Cuscuta campestris]|uniref:Expansin-like EG45 domain-containing protein n=1 Tax=Cuscuta campestris TaxID=132261 RepID=A0A484MBA4_9ASTE|nr:unnamed protein product [Cuscuta campestris]
MMNFMIITIIITLFILVQVPAGDCFVQSRATYYPNSDDRGTEIGSCGYGAFGATINGGDVTAASNLYRDGVGCGACYQVRCTDAAYCSDKGVTAVITDSGASDRTDFILSRGAFGRMANTKWSAQCLLSQGVVDIQYQRVPCSYPNKNMTFKIHEKSINPHYLAFAIWYQQGLKDITALLICEIQNFKCKLMDRAYGAVWATTSPPCGPLQIRMLLSGNDEDAEETWVVALNNIPENWKAGEEYDSGIQIN